MKHLRKVAIGLAAAAAGMLFVATREAPTATPPVAVMPDAPSPVVEPAAVAPPKVEGVRATAKLVQLGVDLAVEVAVTLARPLVQKEFVTVKARCDLEGESYTGVGFVNLRDVPTGTNVVPVRVSLGGRHAFTQLPTRCTFGVEYTSFVARPSTHAWLAKVCWDGKDVVDHACEPRPRDTGLVTVSAVRVATSAERYRIRRLGAPVDLEVSLDAELANALDDWSLEVAADCTLPDGTTQHASSRVFTSDVHAGRPFTSRALLFHGAQQMLDVPTSCTVAVQLADRAQLVREPVSAWCWRDGAVAAGACG